MVEYSGAVWEHMNQAWRVDDGVGCKTEMGLVTGMGKRTTGKGGKKGGQNLERNERSSGWEERMASEEGIPGEGSRSSGCGCYQSCWGQSWGPGGPNKLDLATSPQ